MKMHELKIFANEEFGQIRTTVDEKGNVLFCGSDVAKALGYAKPGNAITLHCKGCTLKQGIPHPQNKNKTIDMIFIAWITVQPHSKARNQEEIKANLSILQKK